MLHCVSAALHDCRVYHASYGELTCNDYQSGYYPSAVSSLVSDPCLLFMCTPEGSSSMKVVFNLLFSVTHVATVRVHRYLTPLYCIWEFPVTQIVRSYCRLYVNCKNHKLSVVCVPFPALVTTSIVTYSKLQMAKTVDKNSFVQIYNTCIPHVPAMGKHEYTKSSGKFVNVYTKQKDIVPISTISDWIYTVLYSLGYYSVWP